VEQHKPQQALARQQTTPADLLRMAVESNADLDRLDKLMALQIKWEADQARKAYVAAMAAFKATPLTIYKDKHVYFENRDGGATEYDHATIGNVTATICAALAKHGFSHRWDTKQESGQITVTCVITHELGHSEATALTALPDQSGKKNPIQSIASAVTYLQRYTLLAATGMATTDQEDDDGQASGKPTEGRTDWDSMTTEEKLANRQKKHDAALARHEDAVRQIKDDLENNRLASAYVNWSEIPQEDRLALWLAPSKGGIFTVAERKIMKDEMPNYRPQEQQP
jgi:hypothetical protein